MDQTSATTEYPVIGIVYTDSFPDAPFLEAVKELATSDVGIAIEKRQSGILYASLEWLVPTAIFAFITKAYFDGLIQSAGADHYIILKRVLKKVLPQFSDTRSIAIGSGGKVKPENPFSSILSIEAEVEPGILFKLLLQRNASGEEVSVAIEYFLSFVRQFHANELTADCLMKLREYNVRGSRILVCFEHESGSLRLIDVMERVDPIGNGVRLPPPELR